MMRLVVISMVVAVVLQVVSVECGLVKRPFLSAKYMPNVVQSRQRRVAENLPFDTAEMNLEAANEMMTDILKDVDLLMNELELLDAARKEVRLTRSFTDGLNAKRYDMARKS